MAKFGKTPEPQFFVNDEDKEAMVEQLVPQTIYSLERLGSIEKAPLADDYFDTFARACAVMIAADTNLDTPAKSRMAAEAMAVHVLRHVKRYLEEEIETGTSAFQRMLNDFEIPEEMKRAWEDS
ncbi:hypothetical protein [Sphingomonas sp. OTU376]|uniref:hypothetical protein n=1 Tax=Sphingomonas sp. OTU376 TaxID=3043863 RepID=UPI00313D95ED